MQNDRVSGVVKLRLGLGLRMQVGGRCEKGSFQHWPQALNALHGSTGEFCVEENSEEFHGEAGV